MPADDSPARAEAAFLGLAIGDALGATSEFMTPAEIRSRYGVLRQIRGGGWLGLRPGQVTDDTEMSLALARAVLACGGWSLPAIADALVAWMRSKPIDIGATVRKGLRSYMLGGGLTVPPNDWDAGNGAVMRMAPVALLTFGDAALLRCCSLEQAHLTHNHPLSDAACVCVGRMLQAALAGADRFCLHALTRELVALHPTFRFDPYSGRASGYVVETLQTVFHFLFTTDNFEDCLVGVVNQGGDADTSGAIAGMLAGAFYGLDAIPRRWQRQLDDRIGVQVRQAGRALLALAPAPLLSHDQGP
ncbi:MAG: ADP-ribosyl-[dinitrogen reductase] hydrolase [Desulfuromonas thiophila]|nr:ADP-ribosyl-[dinitrogen reductase] hydrolase [Desulfuromonas thiophila]